MDKYCIKDGYQSRNETAPCDLTEQIADGVAGNLQRHVYEAASKLPCETVLDIGCGSGYKLMQFFVEKRTIGTEIEPNLEACRREYPERDWLESNFDVPRYAFDIDLVVCADVIEHLLEPDECMAYIARLQPKYIVLSTPDRELLPDEWRRDNGPPFNHRHIREWTTLEFVEYCKKWFPDYELKSETSPVGVMVILTKEK